MNPRLQIPVETWRRLSALQEGDLSADETAALLDDPTLAEPIQAMHAQRAALLAPVPAPRGFADRVLAAVEHEPIPANRPWWRRTEVVLLAVAAAAVVWVAVLPPDLKMSDAPAQIALPRQTPQKPAPEAALPVTPAEQGVAAQRPGKPAKGGSDPAGPAVTGEGAAPAVVAVPTPDGAGGTADAVPIWVRQYGYALTATDPDVVKKLRDTVASLGAHLEDASGKPVSAASLAASGGSVFLTIPADRSAELDEKLRQLGAVPAHQDAEALVSGTLQVQIIVALSAPPR